MSRLSSQGKLQSKLHVTDYRPTLSQKTRELSKSSRKNGPIHDALHNELEEHSLRRQQMVEQDVRKYKKMSARSSLKNNQMSQEKLEE